MPYVSVIYQRDCMKLGEVDGKKIGCTVSLLVSYTLHPCSGFFSKTRSSFIDLINTMTSVLLFYLRMHC